MKFCHCRWCACGIVPTTTAPAGHHGVKLGRASLDLFTTWMDTYAQHAGTFSPEQEKEMERLRHAWAELLIEPAVRQAAVKKVE